MVEVAVVFISDLIILTYLLSEYHNKHSTEEPQHMFTLLLLCVIPEQPQEKRKAFRSELFVLVFTINKKNTS